MAQTSDTSLFPPSGQAPARHRSPAVATSLSFLWPGLGQAYAGRRQAALVFAIPVIVVFALLLIVAIRGLGGLAGLLINPTSALLVTLVIVLLGLWRIVAMVDAMTGLGERGGPERRRGSLVFAILTVVTVVIHGWAAYAAWSFYQAGQEIFVSEATPTALPSSGASVAPPQEAFGPDFEPTPFATPETKDARVNVLMIGVDSAEDRNTMLTDTMLVISVDPTTGDVAMVSFPRDIADFELPDGRTFTGKINSLMAWARHHPKEFPDGPLPTLANSLGYLLGIPIHYYAAIDLAGFSRMIDVVGGVTVNNPKPINDPTYGWLDGHKGFRLSAGKHRLDGEEALAFVRTRKGLGDSDFGRARRQQELLLALRREVAKPDTLARIPELTKAAGKTVNTNFPPDRVGEFIDLALALDLDNIEQVVLGPPYTKRAKGPDVTDYRIRLDMDKVAEISKKLFGNSSRYAQIED